MKAISLQKVAEVCGGTYVGPVDDLEKCITGVQIDSRKVTEGDLFVAIPGERVDGHDFVAGVLEKGATAALCQREPEGVLAGYILVESTVTAMQALAAYYREWIDVKVVGITGSVGKTSTKEMIAAVLGVRYPVLKTEGNFNNGIGLPLTIFRIEPEHQIAVLEMGISDFGEMHMLAGMAQPDICVITNIGMCHLENLKTRDGILKAKTECFAHLHPGGAVVLNGDDDKLSQIVQVAGEKPVFYGISGKSLCETDIWADQIQDEGLDGMTMVLHAGQDACKVSEPIPGAHNVYNVLAAAAVARQLGMPLEEIAIGASRAATISGRTNLIHAKGITVIDDCYNANPVSMRASLDVLSTAKGRKIAVLGDMGELGKEERKLHYDVGEYAGHCPIDYLFCVGTLAEEIVKGAKASNPDLPVVYEVKKEAIIPKLLQVLQEQDTVLVKASHFMEFTSVVKELTE